MRQQRQLILSLLVFLALGLVPTSSSAQSKYTFGVGLMLGLGGSTDSIDVFGASASADTGFGNVGFQGIFTMETQRDVLFGARIGQIDLEVDDAPAFDAGLTYLTLSGEYRLTEGFYESGLFLGLGLYDLSPDVDCGPPFCAEDEEAFGLTLGVTGDFHLSDRFSLLVEFSGHYADLDYAQLFFMGHVGLMYHF